MPRQGNLRAIWGCLVFGCVLSACQSSPNSKKAPSLVPQPMHNDSPEQLVLPPSEATSEESPAAGGMVSTSPERNVAPEKKKRRYIVAVLGDSITDVKSGGGGYLKILREACPESEFHNFGKGGTMTNQMRRRWLGKLIFQIEALKLDTLLVYGGVNDLYSDITANRKNNRIEEDLSKIYSSAQQKGLEVVAITVSPWGGFSKYFTPHRGRNTQLLNSWIMGQVATGLVDKAIDSYAPLSCGVPTHLCAEYQLSKPDGIHPGKRGHEILGKSLLEKAFSDCL